MAMIADDPRWPPVERGRFWFVIGRAMGTVVVTLHGEADSAGVEQLRDALEDLIDNQGNLHVVVDLRGLRRVDPACVAVFAAASAWACDRGGTFSVHDPSPAVTAAFEEAVENA